jgi:hypothetical protein
MEQAHSGEAPLHPRLFGGMEHQGKLHQHQGTACRPAHQASWEDQVSGALLQDRDGPDFPQDDTQDLGGENDGNKSLYLVFVGVIFLSILDCF